jgi:hypothetical protein
VSSAVKNMNEDFTKELQHFLRGSLIGSNDHSSPNPETNPPSSQTDPQINLKSKFMKTLRDVMASETPMETFISDFSVHKLTPGNSVQASNLTTSVFRTVNEPLGRACGLDKKLDCLMVADAISQVSLFSLSLLVFYKDKVIAAMIVAPPHMEWNWKDDYGPGNDRLYRAMEWVDEMVEKTVDPLINTYPELAFGAVDTSFTGAVGTGTSLGSFMYSLTARSLTSLRKWKALKSHSNDDSWRSKERAGGWKHLYSVKYTDMDDGIVVDKNVAGSLHVVTIDLEFCTK